MNFQSFANILRNQENEIRLMLAIDTSNVVFLPKLLHNLTASEIKLSSSL